MDMFWAGWWHMIWPSFLTVPIALVLQGGSALLHPDWRGYLTRRMLRLYVNEGNGFYRLSMQHSNVDHPDERIAQNIGCFTNGSVTLKYFLADDLLSITMSSIKLFAISPQLFYILIPVSVLYNCIAWVFLPRVLAVEASLRYCPMRIRESAESVAFFRGFKYDNTSTSAANKAWTMRYGPSNAEYKKTGISVLYQLFENLTSMGIAEIPMLMIAPLCFQDKVTYCTVLMSVRVFSKAMGGMKDLGDRLQNISHLGAQAIRIKDLWDALQKIQEEGKGEDAKSEASTGTDPEGYSDIEGLTSADEAEVDLPEEIDPVISNLRLQLSQVGGSWAYMSVHVM